MAASVRGSTSGEDDDRETSIAVPRILISGLQPRAGVSTLTLGLLASLAGSKVSVCAATLGSSLGDGTRNRRVSGRLCYTLDPCLLDHRQLIESLGRAAAGAELVVLEGSTTLRGEAPSESSLRSELGAAALLKAPVVLVVDMAAWGEEAKGELEVALREGELIAGVVGNRLSEEAHEVELKHVVAGFGDRVSYLGSLPSSEPERFAGRASVSLHRNTALLTRNQVLRLRTLVEASIDIDALRAIARRAGEIAVMRSAIAARPRICRVAIADDQAFYQSIQDNVDLMRRAGAELLSFSPLIDNAIPAGATALYLPGVALEPYFDDLCGNKALLQAIRDFSARGGLIYAEGTAAIYLCTKAVLPDGSSYSFAGLLPGTGICAGDPGSGGPICYYDVDAGPSMLSRYSSRMRGFSADDWAVHPNRTIPHVLTTRALGASTERPRKSVDGMQPVPNLIATSIHLHWASAEKVALSFVEQATATVLAD